MNGIGDIPRAADATKIHDEATLRPAAKDVRTQLVNAFKAQLAAGKAVEGKSTAGPTLSVTIDIELNTRQIRETFMRGAQAGQFPTDMDVQFAIRAGSEAFLKAMQASNYDVRPTEAILLGYGNGGHGYGKFTAEVSWQRDER